MFSQDWENSFRVVSGDIINRNSEINDNGETVFTFLFSDSITYNSTTEHVAGSYDIGFGKTDANGDLLWMKVFGGPNLDFARSVDYDSKGNVFILGDFTGYITFTDTDTLKSTGNTDIFLAKFNANGEYVWAKLIGTSSVQQTANSILIDKESDDEILVCGYYRDSLIIGDPVQDPDTLKSDYTTINTSFNAKLDSTGAVIWSNTYSGNHNGSRINDIQKSGDGYYFGGTYRNDLTIASYNLSSLNGNFDIFLFKTNFDGDVQWLRKVYGSVTENYKSIATDEFNNVYLLGNYTSSSLNIDSAGTGTKIINENSGGWDTFIGKYNRSGILQWAVVKGSAATDVYSNLAIKNDIIYATGYFADTIIFNKDTLTTSGSSNQDVFLSAFNNIGDPISGISIEGTGDYNDGGSSVVIDNNVQAHVLGYFNSSNIQIGSSNYINDSPGTRDLFYAVYSHPFTAVITDEENPTCVGASDGMLTATPYFGVGPYSFLWSDGQTDSIATGLAGGTYQVTITDKRDSTTIGVGTVNEPTNIALSFAGTGVSCYKGFDGSIDLTVSGGSGGYSYVWSGGTGLSPVLQDQSGLSAAKYNVTVTDKNGCQQTGDTTLTEPGEIFINPDTISVTTVGGSDGAINLSVYGGTPSYTYNWSGPSSYTSTSEDITGLLKGTYYITVTDNNTCTKDSAIVVEEPGFIAYISTKQDVSCKGAGDGQAAVTVENGDGTFPNQYSFAWKDSSGNSIGSGAAISGLSGGKYFVTVTDIVTPSNIDSTSVVIHEPSAVLNVSELATQPSCYGENNAYINLNVSGGTPLYEFIWSTGDTTEDLTNIPSSEIAYSYTVTDQNNCQKTGSLVIGQEDSIVLTITPTNPTCPGTLTGSATVNAIGGTGFFQYQWNDDGNQTEAIATNLAAGTYKVTVTDFTNCTNSKSVTLIDPTPVSISNIQAYSASCNGFADGSVKVTATGGSGAYNYIWSPSAPNSDSISSLAANTYFVTVNDVNNCTPQATSAIVNEPVIISINVDTTDITCFGFDNGSIDIVATGGSNSFIYDWSNGESTSLVNSLAPGMYSVTISDGSCPDSILSNIPIVEPSAIVIDIDTTHLLCNDDANGKIKLTVTGGTNNYTYNWSTGSDKDSIFDLNGGMYSVTVSDGSCPDSVINDITVNEPSKISITDITSTDLSCFGINDGTISVLATGGSEIYEYSWVPAQKDTSNIDSLEPGNYTVTVKNAICALDTTTAQTTISEPNEISIINIVKTDASSSSSQDGTIQVSAVGGTGALQFTVDNEPYQSNNSFTELASKNYVVKVTDVNNCGPVSDSVVIGHPSSIDFNIINNNNIYPNPASDYSFISFNNTINKEDLYLVNILGQKFVPKSKLQNNTVRITLEELPEGHYFVFLGNVTIGKLIIRR